MSATVIAFFNGGVGKTSLVYHLAWMYADLGTRVVAADLDPQANLTAAFLDEDRLEELWPNENHPNTIFGCVQPLIEGTGDIADPHIVLQHSMRLDRPVKAYDRWIARIPEVYRTDVLDRPGGENISISKDPHSLGLLKHYRSLMPLAHEARKPMFHLKPADGAIGGHVQAAQSAYQNFETLAHKIAVLTGVKVSET